jgi:hypothetical protein
MIKKDLEAGFNEKVFSDDQEYLFSHLGRKIKRLLNFTIQQPS